MEYLNTITPFLKRFWKATKEFTINLPKILRSSKFLQWWLVANGIIFCFMILYFIIVPSSKIIQACKSIYGLVVFFALFQIITTIVYTIFLFYRRFVHLQCELVEEFKLKLIHTTDTPPDSPSTNDESRPIESQSESPTERLVDNPPVLRRTFLSQVVPGFWSYCWKDEYSHSTSQEAKKHRLVLLLIHFIFVFLLISLTILILVIFSYFMYYWTHTLPLMNGGYIYPGIKDTKGVEIIREKNGMIHIVASNENDLVYAQGVACAEERLWQMELQRRLGQGTLSEIVGNAGVEMDRYFRTLGLYTAAKAAIPYLKNSTITIINSYVNGINDYLATFPSLPLEFHLLNFVPKKWEIEDVIVWTKIMSLDLSMNYRRELKRYNLLVGQGISAERIDQLIPGYPTTAPTILSSQDININFTRNFQENSQINEYKRLVPEKAREKGEKIKKSAKGATFESLVWNLESFLESQSLENNMQDFFGETLKGHVRASNNWVVGGAKTDTGMPYLANDPHLGLTVPSIWILMHLENTGEGFSSIGASFAGAPGTIIGHNDYFAWGVTNIGADVQDLYIVDDYGDGIHYWSNGQLLEYNVTTETISVRGDSDVKFTLKKTIYGPIINDVEDIKGKNMLALRWVSLDDQDTTLDAFSDLVHAKNFSEFKEALRSYVAPAQNFIYADTHGHIAYQCPGKIPIRQEGHSGGYPVHTNGSFEWKEYIPFDELPFTFDPPEGFIVTANNRLPPLDYPYSILYNNDWEEPYRAMRIREMILNKEKLNFNDMKTIQFDETTLLFRDFKPLLERITNGGKWRDMLLSWDGNENKESREATLFELWYIELSKLPAEEVGQEHWDVPLYLISALLNGSDPNCDKYDGGCLGFAEQAWQKALKKYGNNVPAWGSVHEMLFEHPILKNTAIGCMYGRSSPKGGNAYTVNPAYYDPVTLDSTGGASYRQIIDLSNFDNSVAIHPIGQSGNLFADTFENFLSLWATGDYVPIMTEGYEAKHRTVLLGPAF